MRIDIITLFPELFIPFLQTGVTRRAFVQQDETLPLIDVRLHQLRDYAQGAYKRVDDRPFGGGPGMVMQAEPLADCIDAIHKQRKDSPPVILFSPIGSKLTHHCIQEYAHSTGMILICGRYEGIDQRFIDTYVSTQISLGDFILSGGEIPALALLDAMARLQTNVLGDADSHKQDSFNPEIDGLLDCPHYTRPELWREQGVPEVLLSGNHAHIEKWRMAQRVQLTQKHRPDLLKE